MVVSDRTQFALRVAALGYLFVLVLVPLGMILFRTFEDGLVAFWESVTTPASISAISLSLTIVAIVVPLNVIFGLVTALALARGRFPGRGIVQAIVDLPFAVSPVIVGVSLILLWGVGGWFGGVAESGFRIIFSLPGMVLATIFVTLPFVVREVEPVLERSAPSRRRRPRRSARPPADLLPHHAPRDPLGRRLRRRADRGPRAGRVRRADRRRRRRVRASRRR